MVEPQLSVQISATLEVDSLPECVSTQLVQLGEEQSRSTLSGDKTYIHSVKVAISYYISFRG